MSALPTPSLEKRVAGVIREHVGKWFGVLKGELAEVKAELAEVKAELAAVKAKTPADWDRGVWRSGETYSRGETATDKGAWWLCQAASTNARPGTNGDWRLKEKAR
jgi:hypothetical protein